MGLTKSTQDFIQKMIDASYPFGINAVTLGCSDKVDSAKILSKYVMSQPVNAVVDLFLPAGDWYFNSCFYWHDRTVNFKGAGVGRTFIYVSPETVGIWANRRHGIVGVNTFSDFWIGAGAKKGNEADGIRLYHQSTVRNVSVSNFPNNGIYIDGFLGGDPEKDANHNASFCKVYDCQISANGNNGIEIQGADANACVTFANDIRNNGGYGIFESSFLGGTHIGSMFHANAKGAYGSDNASNQSAFFGGYIENDQPPNQFMSNDVKVFGGFNVTGNKNGKIY